jgi:hypothetical protein
MSKHTVDSGKGYKRSELVQTNGAALAGKQSDSADLKSIVRALY